MHRLQICAAVANELDRAYAKHGDLPWGRHEFYVILKEEVDELWDAIKGNRHKDAAQEAVQVAAMALAFIVEVEGKP